MTLGTDVAYSLDVNLNAGEANIDLAGLRVGPLTAQGNAVGTSQLLLHDATVGRLDVQINAGDLKIALPAGAEPVRPDPGQRGSIALCADPGTGLRLRNTSTVTGDNFAAAGLVRSGTTWEIARHRLGGARRRPRPAGHGRKLHAQSFGGMSVNDRLYRSVDDRVLGGVCAGLG